MMHTKAQPHAPRDGFALVAALVAIALIGALIAGAFFAATQERRLGASSGAAVRALGAAELAAYGAVDRWDKRVTLRLPVGASLPPDSTRGSPDVLTVVRATKLSPSAIAVVADARVGGRTIVGAQRRIGNVARFARPRLTLVAALAARGLVQVTGSAFVSGVDATPAAWASDSLCAPGGLASQLAGNTPDTVAAVASPDTTRICDGTCGSGGGPGARLDGAPQRLELLSLADTVPFRVFGAERWWSLAAVADIVAPPGSTVPPFPATAGITCDTSAPANWGDPQRGGPCADYFPLIWAPGDLTIAGGRGQGILLVEGDLTIVGPVTFAGVVLVRGRLRTAGGPTLVAGAVLVESPDAAGAAVIDGATSIVYSRCAVGEALAAAPPLLPIARRGWVQLF
jgi:type II secretory pathway pseudopilin PulG